MTALGDRILKVDHAGEHGAVNIYRAQIFCARYNAPDMLLELQSCLKDEQRHRAIFAREMAERQLRYCRSYWLCGIGGWTLGMVSGLLGRQAIAATTVAVEQVVLRHLVEQRRLLCDSDAAAYTAVDAIVSEEQQHHDGALQKMLPQSLMVRMLTPMVKIFTEGVIWLGMRL